MTIFVYLDNKVSYVGLSKTTMLCRVRMFYDTDLSLFGLFDFPIGLHRSSTVISTTKDILIYCNWLKRISVPFFGAS